MSLATPLSMQSSYATNCAWNAAKEKKLMSRKAYLYQSNCFIQVMVKSKNNFALVTCWSLFKSWRLDYLLSLRTRPGKKKTLINSLNWPRTSIIVIKLFMKMLMMKLSSRNITISISFWTKTIVNMLEMLGKGLISWFLNLRKILQIS